MLISRCGKHCGKEIKNCVAVHRDDSGCPYFYSVQVLEMGFPRKSVSMGCMPSVPDICVDIG